MIARAIKTIKWCEHSCHHNASGNLTIMLIQSVKSDFVFYQLSLFSNMRNTIQSRVNFKIFFSIFILFLHSNGDNKIIFD